jgi:heat shock protein HtpX
MQTELKIAPSRAAATSALLAILAIVGSYLFLFAVAIACVVLSYVLLFSFSNASMSAWVFAAGFFVAGCCLLWSMVPKRDRFEAPWLSIKAEDQPQLFEEIRTIAANLGEPAPEEIYLVGELNAFVADRGGILGFGSRRILGIGLPALAVLTVSEMRTLLAHEFAHFYSGDTRLGPWIQRARMAIGRGANNLDDLQEILGIHAVRLILTLTRDILSWYHNNFLKMINHISRRQELRCDELAAIVAGQSAMIQMLSKLHAYGFLWGFYWQSEVFPLLEQNFVPPIGEGFLRYLKSPEISEISPELIRSEEAEGQLAPAGSHPPLSERIAALQELEEGSAPIDDRMMTALIVDLPTLELRFVENMYSGKVGGKFRPVAWSHAAEQVFLPKWKADVERYGHLFEGVRAESVPILVENRWNLGAKLPDPKGRLLTPAERAQSASRLIGYAVGLLLVEQGWKLVSSSGVFEMRKGEDKVKPLMAIFQLGSHGMSAETWKEQCRTWEIAEKLLYDPKADSVIKQNPI